MANQNRYGIDNLTYDLVTLLHEKSKGLEAYQQYAQDAQSHQKASQLLQQLQQQDQQAVQQLRDCLSELLQQSGSQKAA